MNYDHDLGRIDTILTLDTTTAPPLGGLNNSLAVIGTGSLVLPTGTTAQRPGTPAAAMLRFNSDTPGVEYYNGATWQTLAVGGGSVTSVALAAPSIFTVSGSPVTTTGTLTFSLNTQTANLVFASPNGSTAAPTFRSLVSADIPSLSYLPLAGGSLNSAASITLSGGGTVTGLPSPTVGSDAANKTYVDTLVQGADPKASVRAATTVAGTLATSFANGQIIDGITLVTGDRILIKNQAAPAENGLYTVNASGAPTRALDMDIWTEVPSSFVWVETGTALADTGWVCTSDAGGTIGTTSITWVQFGGIGSYTGTAPVSVSGSTISLTGLSSLGASNQIIGANNAATALEYKTVTQGTGITVTNAAGSITIANVGVTGFAIATADQATGLVLSAATGSITLTLDSVLDSIAGIAAAGIIARTGAGTSAARTITGTTNTIAVTNGAGTAGDPTITIASDAILPGTGAVTVVSGTTAQQPAAGAGKLRYDTTTNQLLWSNTTTWSVLSTGGTVTSVAVSGGTTGLTTSGGPITTSGTITLAGTLGVGNGGTGLTTTPTNGQLLIGNGTNYTLTGLTAGAGITVTPGAGSITIANAGVTSVALAAPSIFTVSGSPVTTTGTLTFSLNTQTANLVFASPNGSTAAPTFRSLAYADLPIKLYAENPSTPTAPTALTGANAIAIGSGAAATGVGAIALGDGTSASIWGGKAYANGRFATAGDAQSGLYVLRNSTVNATSTELFLDGSTQRLVPANNSVWTFKVLVAARRTDAVGGGAGYSFEGALRKDTTAASLALIGAVSKTILGETNAAWDVSLTADVTNGSLKIAVVGEAAKTIRWVATVITTEVTN